MIEHVGILITPQAIADGIAEAIIHDLIELTGMNVLWKKRWCIGTERVFDLIYPALGDRPFKGTMVKNLTSGASLVVLASGEMLYPRLKEVKGKFKRHPDGTLEITGLRLKYKQPQGSADENTMYDFRFHTADTNQETTAIINLCASLQEIEVIKKIVPEFFKEVT